MTQQWASRAEREDQAGEELAARLDALSRPLAERVLGRAIELDHEARAEAEAAAETIDFAALKEVAFEVGISEDALKRALLEELDTDIDHNARPIERATVPDTVRGGLIVHGTADDVQRRLSEKLEDVATVIRRGRPAQVAARTVPQARGNRQLVEVEAATAEARKRAWQWVIGMVIVGALFGNAIGGLIMLGLVVAGIATVVSWVRRIGRRARRAINRALSGLVDAEAEPAQDWLELWERVRD